MEKNYKCYETDEYLYNSYIKTKLKLRENVKLFCSFTYITPNYINLFILNELSKLAKEGYELFIVIWDMNSITNNYFKRQISPSIGHENPSQFMDKKIKEIENLLYSLDVDPKKIHIYKSSDLWKRMISIKNPNLFLKLYQILTSMNISEFTFKHKISHFIQMPADLFFANYFNILFPEDTEKPMDVIFAGDNKEIIYVKTRQLLYENGFICSGKPIFLFAGKSPYIIADDIVPELNMSLEEIISILNRCQLNEDDIKNLFETIISDKLSIAHYLNAKGDLLEIPIKLFPITIKKLPLENKNFSIAYNLYDYMRLFEQGFKNTRGYNNALKLTNKDQIYQIGKLFKSKPLVEVMLYADGTKTISQIAKAINKQVANVSSYVNTLRKDGFVSIDHEGKVKRNYDAVKINLDKEFISGEVI